MSTNWSYVCRSHTPWLYSSFDRSKGELLEAHRLSRTIPPMTSDVLNTVVANEFILPLAYLWLQHPDCEVWLESETGEAHYPLAPTNGATT